MKYNFTTIYAPEFPESVTNATIIEWKKNIYDKVKKNETVLEIETDKIIMSVQSPSTGLLKKIYKKRGSSIFSKEKLGEIKENIYEKKNNFEKKTSLNNPKEKLVKIKKNIYEKKISPSTRRFIRNHGLKNKKINSIIEKDRITKTDIKKIIKDEKIKKNILFKKNFETKYIEEKKDKNKRKSDVVVMSNLRKKISERLSHTKNNSIMLTTFNEVNMKKIINIRNKYKKVFEKKYNTKLGFMSFFIKAVIESLKEFPEINTSINGEKITYYKYYDINIAISTNKGLVAPIIKNVDTMSMSEIEKKILYLKKKAENGNLKISEMLSGNFTISNGGIFGSLFSTPIINPPQTAILGINVIKNRPIVIKNKIKIRPMTYLSLSYDHRVIDGKSSIKFLEHIKNLLEDFSRVIIQI
ncbi:dihydrolipoyllysine-residue succinyltransferase [Buchnera aphidicola (Astegopteryx bambusae)]|uniref:dihydrolipoyllysine-residue succinyltransferase n=1 Tax=Buchnera aphidicola TaxID=9 RepID=UPI0031B80ED0